jgi:hypothetical protein
MKHEAPTGYRIVKDYYSWVDRRFRIMCRLGHLGEFWWDDKREFRNWLISRKFIIIDRYQDIYAVKKWSIPVRNTKIMKVGE